MYREAMEKKFATMHGAILHQLAKQNLFAIKKLDPTQNQTLTTTNREHHLQEVITLTTIAAVEEVPTPEVQAAEVDLVQVRVRRVQAEEINVHIHYN